MSLRTCLLVLAALVPIGSKRVLGEVRLDPRQPSDRVALTAVLAPEESGCLPALRSIERDPPALATRLLKRLTVRLDAVDVGECPSSDDELEIPLGVLPSGRYALDVLLDDPDSGEERYLDGTTFDVFAAVERDRLSLDGGRFVATAEWGPESSATRAQTAGPQTSDSGLFWFFEPDNWEISVKLLDACEINDRYWLLGAATTDVAWRLEIADRVSGDHYRAEHRGGVPSPALIDVDAFDCDETEGCGSGVLADILASPRADPDAERLAILLDGTVAASSTTYSRLARDLAEIHRIRPETRTIVFVPPFSFESLSLVLTPAGKADLGHGGELSGASCLDARYGRRTLIPVNEGTGALLGFDAILDVRRIAGEYAALPSVAQALVRETGGPLPQGAPPQVCVARDGELWLYYLRGYSPLAPEPWFHFASNPLDGVEEIGSYERGDLEPPWLESARECLEDLGLE